MELQDKTLQERDFWVARGIRLPAYDRQAMREATKRAPVWVHFGTGNLFRGYIAGLQEELLDSGAAVCGILAAETYDRQTMEQMRENDLLCLQAVLCADGTVQKRVIASVAEAAALGGESAADWDALCGWFRAPSLQQVSFTITEKGYRLGPSSDERFPTVEHDMQAGPDALMQSLSGQVTALCRQRFLAGGAPLALLSLDNCAENGRRLSAMIWTMAEEWLARGLAEEAFVRWLKDPGKVSFPWSMIDRITPSPSPDMAAMLAADGVDGMEIRRSAQGGVTAPFVNTEECAYLAIEDAFPNGRPPLERAGVVFAAREVVAKAETMKVCTCLNPLHTALAVFGCLLGHTRIAQEMRDDDLRDFVTRLGREEMLPAAVHPGVFEPEAFLKEVLTRRLPNAFLPDTPQRIAADTSQKMPVRFGRTLAVYASRGSAQELRLIPLVIAGWLRYLVGVDDAGKMFAPSPDPLLPVLQAALAPLSFGRQYRVEQVHEVLAPLLSDPALFGVDLYAAGLGERVEALFTVMTARPGAVRETLRREMREN